MLTIPDTFQRLSEISSLLFSPLEGSVIRTTVVRVPHTVLFFLIEEIMQIGHALTSEFFFNRSFTRNIKGQLDISEYC
jgi:hypothetical protein